VWYISGLVNHTKLKQTEKCLPYFHTTNVIRNEITNGGNETAIYHPLVSICINGHVLVQTSSLPESSIFSAFLHAYSWPLASQVCHIVSHRFRTKTKDSASKINTSLHKWISVTV